MKSAAQSRVRRAEGALAVGCVCGLRGHVTAEIGADADELAGTDTRQRVLGRDGVALRVFCRQSGCSRRWRPVRSGCAI